MKVILRLFTLILLSGTLSCGAPHPSQNGPGNLFIRQQICDLNDFKKTFLSPAQNLKAQGFMAYSIHRDLKDPKTYILTLKCSDLKKALDYVLSSNFHGMCVGAGVGIPVIWAGLDVIGRKYEPRAKMTGGIVVAHNVVRSYDFWKACWDAEGHHNHPDRGYKSSNYSIHHLPGSPDIVLVVHEASDITKAPAFMTSSAMKGVMEASGVTNIDFWYGTNLEEGTF